MLDEFCEAQAAVYALGGMEQEEREQFDLLLDCHEEVRRFTGEMEEIAAAMALPACTGIFALPPAEQAQIKRFIMDRPEQMSPEGLVRSAPDGSVQWVSAAFSQMCGYSLEELCGKKLGRILQGPETDSATAERMRCAVREHRVCRETILNYHKNGTPYWVDVSITPVLDAAGEPLWLLAREREVIASGR